MAKNNKPPEDAIQKLRKAKMEEKKKEQVEEVKQQIGQDLPEVFYVVREIDIKTYELLKIRCNPNKLNSPALIEDKVVFENRVAGRAFTMDQDGLGIIYERIKRRE